MKASWEEFLKIISSNVYLKKSIFIKWTKLFPSFVKLNTDGSCRNDSCGGGGIVRDHEGKLIIDFSLVVGQGTSNWAEAVALLFRMSWCRNNGYKNVQAENDSKLLVDCVKKKSTPPWTIANEVKRLQDFFNQSEYSITHYNREINQVADNLASLSHNYNTNILYSNNGNSPPKSKGL
ncbi:hypothetical protein MTR67_001637 [Solanum verrucosum]|uniref:RNase H type-1 domain-containing protein n=1 Tax=Solanum verrucosum TaxID=315347 RepID=A0AAF0PPK7_SOLVR|nr:hypothetical protein MTR67_001637 [Solanum verrucosum]